MPQRRFREGDEVEFQAGGRVSHGTFLGFADQSQQTARIRLTDGSVLTVSAFVLTVTSRHRERWWSGIDRRIQLGVLAVGVLGLAVTAIASFSGSDPSGSSGSAPRENASKAAPQSTLQPESALNLHGTLEAFNETYGRHWGATITAEPTDTLRFKLVLKNSASQPTADLALDYLTKADPSPLVITAFQPAGLITVPTFGPRATIRTVSGLGSLVIESAYEIGPNANSTRSLAEPIPNGGIEIQPGLGTAGEYDLGIIPAHGQITVFSEGEFAVPNSSGRYGEPIEEGSVVLLGHTPSRTLATTLDASAGERLWVAALLHNGGFHSAQIHLAAALRREGGGQFYTISSTVTQLGSSPQTLGHAIVNAAGAKAIHLSVVPHSTALFSENTVCSRIRLIQRLPDGIAEGGVDVGSIGGFRPRDPCSGVEFSRSVIFAVSVS
jgi:hypothetical protein